MEDKSNRRQFLTKSLFAVGSTVAMPYTSFSQSFKKQYKSKEEKMNPIKNIKELGFQWETPNPFLFCVHHEDNFPKGNEEMGPDKSYLNGRHLGDDFIIKDGFRMYHGKKVPGFPGHPHRGFETITVVRKGIVDHSDSMGAAGRYGNGDVQWMTAGKGVQHAEMFPLIHQDKENNLELFQIWLNLPKKNKMVEPHFKMFWRENLPVYKHKFENKEVRIEVIAGKIDKVEAPAPPPNSWAADKSNEVAVWNIKMEKGAQFKLPQASKGINRTLYYYEGEGLTIYNKEIHKYSSVELDAEKETILMSEKTDASILVLQGRPIDEPVIQYGPFVMNTKAEIQQAFEDYQNTQFGGWPWARYDYVHPKNKGRFALHSDGKEENKGTL